MTDSNGSDRRLELPAPARRAWLQAAKCHDKAGSPYRAAWCRETAGDLVRAGEGYISAGMIADAERVFRQAMGESNLDEWTLARILLGLAHCKAIAAPNSITCPELEKALAMLPASQAWTAVNRRRLITAMLNFAAAAGRFDLVSRTYRLCADLLDQDGSSAVELLRRLRTAALHAGNILQAAELEQRLVILDRIHREKRTEGFVSIPGGSFKMGSPETEQDRLNNEGPVHTVRISPFWMSETPITKAQFSRFVEDSGYRTDAEKNGGGFVLYQGGWTERPDAWWDSPYMKQDKDHPVVLVSWYDAVDYCKWRSKLDNLKPAYEREGDAVKCIWEADGYRLPTEAEWEYACRAGTDTPFHFGDSLDSGMANFDGNYPYGRGGRGLFRKGTTKVKSFEHNGWGLYDMHGNVWEWCWDWYDESYYMNSPEVDPKGQKTGSNRVLRGGGWVSDAGWCRSAGRDWDGPRYRDSFIGFRVVRRRSQD